MFTVWHFKHQHLWAKYKKKTGSNVVCVFVPTTPNPTSGFIIIVPKEDVIELDMEIDEAFKMIVSLGVVVPEWKKKELIGD